MDAAPIAPAAPPLTALRHKHLLGIADLSAEEIVLILDTAEAMKEVGQRTIKKVPTLRGRTVINLFFEPSTRTRTSFEIAEKRLSADTLNVAIASSSVRRRPSALRESMTARNVVGVDVCTPLDAGEARADMESTLPEVADATQ